MWPCVTPTEFGSSTSELGHNRRDSKLSNVQIGVDSTQISVLQDSENI